jgi:LacI family transcriptional regulator
MGKAGKEGGGRQRSPRRAHRGPTIADVAREAGVSPMTVSRAINGEVRVQPETRERVEAAVLKLGYVPNAAARSLAGAQPCRLALVHDNPSAAWLSEVLVGCLAEASDSDAQLLIERREAADSMDALARHLASHRIDAVILPPPLGDDGALLQALHDARIPVVQVATGRPSDKASAVSIDDEAAAKAMTAHLIALGHRRIGFVEGNPHQTASALRRAGYEAALHAAGVAVDTALIAPGDFSYRSGLAAAEALLALPDRPTAIFASNDDMAAAVIAVAHRQRLDVPRALTVCGFDDTAMATTIWPELTTIRQPSGEMARIATRIAIAAVRSPAPGAKPLVRHEQLEFELIRRSSDSAPGDVKADAPDGGMN